MTDWNGLPPLIYRPRPFLDHILRRKSDRALVCVRFHPDAKESGHWQFQNSAWINPAEAAARFSYFTPIITSGDMRVVAGDAVADSDRLDWLESKALQIEDVTVSSYMDVEGNTAFSLSIETEGTDHKSLRAAIDAVRQASDNGQKS